MGQKNPFWCKTSENNAESILIGSGQSDIPVHKRQAALKFLLSLQHHASLQLYDELLCSFGSRVTWPADMGTCSMSESNWRELLGGSGSRDYQQTTTSCQHTQLVLPLNQDCKDLCHLTSFNIRSVWCYSVSVCQEI